MVERLLAKRIINEDGKIPYAATLQGHLEQVFDVSQVIGKVLKDQILHSFFNNSEWSTVFRKALMLAAVLHDLGKANVYFQNMVQGHIRNNQQPIRHEIISDWILRHHTGIRKAVFSVLGLPESESSLFDWRFVSIRIAVLGHHLKFPREAKELDLNVEALTRHADFLTVCQLLQNLSGLKIEPEIVPPLRIQGRWLIQNIEWDLEDALDASGLGEEVRGSYGRFASLLRIMLITADSLGSVNSNTREEWESSYLPEIESALYGKELTPYFSKLREYRLKGKVEDSEISEFQQRVAASNSQVTIVEAGCGSGKTLASNQWAVNRKAQNFFLAYPTTATATQGYVDYGMEVPEVSRLLHSRSGVDMELLTNGESEELDWIDAVERIRQPLVMCTVDTILGVLQNYRPSIILFPKLLNSVVVFDEVHAYDDRLFQHLLEFLRYVPIPVLLMSASLQPERKQQISRVLTQQNISVNWITGPSSYEQRKRYQVHVVNQLPTDQLWNSLANGEKVLLVVNQIEIARGYFDKLTEEVKEKGIDAKWFLYHARFEYQDRVERQQEVVNAFRGKSACCVITTQISEMSFDISADLLLSEISDFPSVIQRLGRLNRYASEGDPIKIAYIWQPVSHHPYKPDQLRECRLILNNLEGFDISQKDLSSALAEITRENRMDNVMFDWNALRRSIVSNPLREHGYTVDCLCKKYLSLEKKPRWISLAKHVIPLPSKGLPKDHSRYRHTYLIPDDAIEYSRIKGGRWKHES